MHKHFVCLMALLWAGSAWSAERKFDFSQMPTNQPPAGCISIVGGEGKPGVWKVLMDEVPLALPPINPNVPRTAPQAVVGQLAWDTTDEHFPMLLLGNDSYGDFTFHTRFKIVDGLVEQMAGVAFRIQDEKNYYYLRASSLGSTFYFYTVLKGQRSAPVGNNIPVERGVWHDLTVECSGPKIHVLLDGKEAMPMLSDLTFAAGKIALWTKSDSISYFTDTRIDYTPRQSFAQLMVQEVMKENPRLLGVEILSVPPKAKTVQLIASNKEREIGQPGEKNDLNVINQGTSYYRRDKETVYVTMPLRDRNGDPVAAVRFVMKGFPGQTEETALIRATPILKKMQLRASSVDSLY